MRIAVLSDIHGNLPALKAVLRDLAHRQVDTIVNLGDSLSGPLQPSETAAFLMAQPWVQLAGNHERQLLEFAPERRGPSDRYAIVEKQGGTWQAQLLAVPYDHAGAADLARQRGRPDWEVALLYGRMKAANPPLQPTASGGG